MKDKNIVGWRIWMYGLALAVLTVLFVPFTTSFEGSGGTITMNGAVGISTYSYSSAISSRGYLDWTPASLYFGGGINGRFQTQANISAIPSNSYINISVIAPANNTAIITTSTTVIYNISTNVAIDYCSIYLDNVLKNTQYSLINGTYNYGLGGISASRHNLTIDCYASGYHTNITTKFTAIIMNFNASSTNVSNVDISAIPNLTLADSSGSIEFSGFTDLSSGANLDANVIISAMSIYVNSAAIPQLNKPSTLTIQNIPYNFIAIFNDGAFCSGCDILSFNAGMLRFNVTGFSNYTVSSNSRLGISDTTDNASVFVNNSIIFTANFTNITSGVAIAANCLIYLNSTPEPMIFASGLYTYNATFDVAGIIGYNVSCVPTAPGYQNLTVTDTYELLQLNSRFLANINITSQSSSRQTIDKKGELNASAGNLTELTLDATTITSSWQGYYGNVTGGIQLFDANNYSFYNWLSVSPSGQIYATRTSSPDWNRIRCANIGELYSEDSYIGINSLLDADSVVNTFQNTTGFNPFYVGIKNINTGQNCYAAKMFNSTGLAESYSEILLTDTNTLIYTGILAGGVQGFDGGGHDFQLIVGQNGRAGGEKVTNYYFYLELV